MDKVLSMKAMVHDIHACSPSDFARQWPCEAVRAAMEMNTAVPSQAKAAQVLAQAQKAVDAAAEGAEGASTGVEALPPPALGYDGYGAPGVYGGMYGGYAAYGAFGAYGAAALTACLAPPARSATRGA